MLKHSRLQLPLEQCFGDTLLYSYWKGTIPEEVDFRSCLKEYVDTVMDETASHLDRSLAALKIGDVVAKEWPAANIGFSQAEDWYGLSLELGNPEAAQRMVAPLLKKLNVKVFLEGQYSPLYLVVSHGTNEPGWRQALQNSSQFNQCVNLWCRAINVTTDARYHGFTGWTFEMVSSAILSIMSYLILPSSTTFQPNENESLTFQNRLLVLQRIRPAWDELIRYAARQHRHDRAAYQQKLQDQQRAVTDFLKTGANDEAMGIEAGTQPDANMGRVLINRTQASHLARAPINTTFSEMAVISGIIPASGERDERLQLKQYERLRQPLKLMPLPDSPRLHEVEETLFDEFPWATEAIHTILATLIAMRQFGSKRLYFAPVLLNGPPGTGKTRFALRLAQLLGTASQFINLAGSRDTMLIKGSARGWAGARPSVIVETILRSEVANPLIILDEVDKASEASAKGADPQAALLDLLEPQNARQYYDQFLLTACDLSACLYIATSNHRELLSGPLRSRLRVIEFPGPGPEHTETLVSGVLRDLEKDWQLPAGVLELNSVQMANLHGLSPRALRQTIPLILSQTQSLPTVH